MSSNELNNTTCCLLLLSLWMIGTEVNLWMGST